MNDGLATEVSRNENLSFSGRTSELFPVGLASHSKEQDFASV
jgi:hypothetical protein